TSSKSRTRQQATKQRNEAFRCWTNRTDELARKRPTATLRRGEEEVMKTYALATALALAVTSPAWAVQVEYRNADIAFAREIGSCFENAPEVLKTKTLSPRVIVVGDSAAMAKVQRETNAPKSDITKFANGFVAVAYRGVLGLQPRTLIFNQDTMKNSSP